MQFYVCLMKSVEKMSFLENPLLYSVQMHDSKKKKKSLIKSVKKMAILTNKDFSLLYSMYLWFHKYVFVVFYICNESHVKPFNDGVKSFLNLFKALLFLFSFYIYIWFYFVGVLLVFFIYTLFNLKMTQCTTICLEPVSNKAYKAWYRRFCLKELALHKTTHIN